jgi:hypothetical protein
MQTGMNAVGADQRVAGDFFQRAVGALKLGHNVDGVLRVANQAPSGPQGSAT